MSLMLYQALAGLLIFITSLIAVIYPLKMRSHPTHHHALELGDALASGIFLGAALFHMLPDAVAGFSEVLPGWHYPLAELICAGGFLLLLFFERLSQIHQKESHLSLIIAVIITLHALIEGTALGVNTSFAAASVIFLAIIAHKSSESFALAVTLNRSTLPLRSVLIFIALFALMTPLGIALGAALTHSFNGVTQQILTAGFNAFAAGTFLYMSTLHHINHHHRTHDKESLWEFFVLVLGLGLMALLAS